MTQVISVVLALMASPFLLWLAFCLIVTFTRPTNEAIAIISSAGRWFPLRIRSPQAQVDARGTDATT